MHTSIILKWHKIVVQEIAIIFMGYQKHVHDVFLATIPNPTMVVETKETEIKIDHLTNLGAMRILDVVFIKTNVKANDWVERAKF